MSGLVLTPAPGAGLDAIEGATAAIPGCSVERRVGGRFVVVAEARDAAAAETLRERLLALPGVLAADVVFATVEDPAMIELRGSEVLR